MYGICSNGWRPEAFTAALFALLIVPCSYAQTGVGIDAATPATKLDVNGDFALRIGALTATNGNNNNINISSWSFVRVAGPTTDFSITGLAGGVNGKMIILHNSTAYNMTIRHQNTGSTTSNRIICPNNSDEVVARGGAIILIYSTMDSRWIAVIQS